MKRILTTTVLLLVTSSVLAEGPYAGMQDRTVKALSEQQVADLSQGRGMGMALPAELNRYPGPTHVLENGAALELSPGQKDELGRQVDAMRIDAIVLGEQVIAQEAILDWLFKSGTADADAIDRTTAALAALYGKLRAVHLRTHLATRATLSETQLARYEALRGYDSKASHPVHKH